MSDPQAEARTIAHLTDLRARLRDVRAIDRWLNVLHSGPTALLLSLVDDSPEAIHSQLCGERDLFFRPVPYPDASWEREYAEDFLAALEEEKAVDLAWREALDAGEVPGSARLCAAEVDVRARASRRLDLPCREEHPGQAAAEWLSQQRVDPDGEMGAARGGQRVLARSEGEFQTAVFPGELRMALAHLVDESELLEQESASDALRVAVGFLEWHASENAAQVQRAPLLLYPVEWVRRGEADRERLGIRGGDLPETNAPLRQKLETDFEIRLPVWEAEDSAQSYLARVVSAIGDRQGWKILWRSALGVFPPSPSWLYSDSDPKNWGGYQNLASAGALHLLLRRTESGTVADPEEVLQAEPSSRPVERTLPLILDADGDQQRVVRAVLEGKDLRVDAPPGTGATQTVLNLVGTFLAEGKSVLVVAEKGRVLRELSGRARDLGLGPFCLELFGSGVRRINLVSSVNEREAVQPLDSVPFQDGLREELESCATRLEQYVALVRQPFGQLEICERGNWRQVTLGDVLWEDIARRAQAPHVPGLDRVWIEDAELLTRADRERRRTHLGSLERAARDMRERWGGVEGHPWGFITRGDIQPADIPDVEEVAAQALVRLEELQACGDALIARMRFDVESSTLTETLDFARVLQSLPPPPEHLPDLLVRMLFLSPEAEARVREILLGLREAQRRREMLAGFFEGRPPEVLEEEEWGDAVSAARAAGLGDVTLKGIASGVDELRRRVKLWGELQPFIGKCLDTFGLGSAPVSAPLLQRMVQALEVLAGVERRLLLVRFGALLEEIHLPTLEAALKNLRELRENEERVRSVYAYDVRLTEMELREHANALLSKGLLARISAAHRRARSQARALIKQHAGLTDEQLAARLHQLADHLEAVRRFEADSSLRQLLGERFRGLETDLESCVEANRFAASVRSRFVGQWEPEASLRRFFLQGTMDDFDSALALRLDPQYAQLSSFLNAAENAPVGLEELVVGWQTAAEQAQRLFRYFGGLGVRAEVTPNQALEVRFCFADLRELREKLDASPLKTWVGPEAWKSEETDSALLETALEYVLRMQAEVPAGVLRVLAAGDLPVFDEIFEVRSQGLTLEGGAVRAVAALRALQGWVANPDLPLAVSPVLAPFLTVGAVYAALRRAQEHGVELSRCVAFRRSIEDLRGDGLAAFLAAYDEAGHDYADLETAYDRVVWRSLARRALESFPELGRVPAQTWEQVRSEWAEAHDRFLSQQRQRMLSRLSSVFLRREGVDGSGQGADSGTGADLKIHLLAAGQTPSTLDWLDQAWEGLLQAKPLMLASPEAVAQHIAPGRLFDLVIVEGACQMRPERGLGVLARARQVVLLADEMGLPVSSFLERHLSESVELVEQRADQVSLWDKIAVPSPKVALRGQYRVQYAALMAFSNRHFYRNEIRVLPAPRERIPEAGCGLRWVNTAGTHRSGVHVREASAIVEEALRCMRDYPERSLAILTWTVGQRALVQSALCRAMATDSNAARYRARWASSKEPLVVRQIDDAEAIVRDTVLVTFGVSEEGGILEGTERLSGVWSARRLNIALTRARLGLTVFCAVLPARIRVDHRTPRALVLLRQLLVDATGGGETNAAFRGECTTAFEKTMEHVLDPDGFLLFPRAGVGQARLDLALGHPKEGPGCVCALTVDSCAAVGAPGNDAQEWFYGAGLERLGWKIYRIWTGEWFRDSSGESLRLREFLSGGL